MRKFHPIYCLIVVIALSTAGCANQAGVTSTAQPQQTPSMKPAAVVERLNATPPQPTSPGEKGAPPTESDQHWISITPFTQVSRYDCESPSKSKCEIRFNDDISGAYTRLIVYNEEGLGGANAANAQELQYTSRGWLSRLFHGVHRTISLTAKIGVGSFAATVPLVTIDHISNKTTGESFSRVIYHQAKNYPLFLVRRDGSNSIVSAQFIVKANDQSQFDAAGPALRLIQNVATLVAPPAAVLTTLTAQSTKNVAIALDQSIGQLFTTTIDEEQWVDDDIHTWGQRVSVTFKIPEGDSDWTATPDRTIGTWHVGFDFPRPSIFSDYQICPARTKLPHERCMSTFAKAAAAVTAKVNNGQVSPEQVLSFHLLGNQPNVDTIKKYLLQQDWYQKEYSALSSAKDKPGDLSKAVASFCRSIKETIVELGLNSLDAGIVVFSASKALDLDPNISKQMATDSNNCGIPTYD